MITLVWFWVEVFFTFPSSEVCACACVHACVCVFSVGFRSLPPVFLSFPSRLVFRSSSLCLRSPPLIRFFFSGSDQSCFLRSFYFCSFNLFFYHNTPSIARHSCFYFIFSTSTLSYGRL
ncbi:hypothetical protein LDENG_00200000 [Lucifuga dentata]|nr:hypothetical protein LDENG_00200000 [Lucifuga dentata]